MKLSALFRNEPPRRWRNVGVETEISALAAKAQSRADRAARLLRRIARLRTVHDAYRRVFFGDDGQLTGDAALVLRDLCALARFGKVDPGASDAELRMNEGRRHVILHLFDRFELDPDKVRLISQRLKEVDDE